MQHDGTRRDRRIVALSNSGEKAALHHRRRRGPPPRSQRYSRRTDTSTHARFVSPAGPRYLTIQSMAAMPTLVHCSIFRVLFDLRITSAELAGSSDNFKLQYSEVLFWLTVR